ncbi:1-phosphofructokinase family hexose kinase [Paenibacillus sp. TRM 82003]|uniref:1-phosphofructokinase family hexose kinase n=1 Tax=Kineococcus sp. TRM81007 TaxID=2925831 RepID=UPI001F56A51E|nr:1-phosphofructokinase family hexose kinase [Kineococcus sp. TRM81007]MCI2240378.1 1-phosphofructokinase family hexose kinase [Kineococcus sp. TRM81007]MCI3927446.1 1-phosphofructokinase family hexose kinase [Paenibacillus sp. TRM 82003]
MSAAHPAVLTVTPNPSIDRTLELDVLTRGEVHRARGASEDAGGKGVNVARALALHGARAAAVLPCGGLDGDRLVGLLAPQGVEVVPVAIAGTVRTNTTVVEADGTTTKLNEPGPVLGAEEVEALERTVRARLTVGPRWLASSGSLPPGAPGDLHARLVRLGRAAGARTAVDTSGPALAAAVEAGPDVVKPNLEELAELVARELTTVGDVRAAAADLRARGCGDVLVSLGEAGALLATAEGTWWAGGPALVPRSTVGAGDCTLAGYLSADGPAPQRLATAVAWGRAAVLLPGSTVPGPEQTRAGAGGVRVVENPDPETPVKDLQP